VYPSPRLHLRPVDRSTRGLWRAGQVLSLRGVFRMRPVVDTWRRSAASGLIALGVPEVVLLVTGHLQLAFFTCAGGLCALYGHGLPYLARARALAWVVLGMVIGTGAALLTAALTDSAVVRVLVLALLAGVFKLVCDASRIGPPGNIIFTFVLSAAGFLPMRLVDVPSRLLLVLCGGVLAWLVCLAPALIRPHDPERFAVARALAATARLLRLPGEAPAAASDRARYDAAAATHAAWHTVRLVPARSAARATELDALIRLLVRAESLAAATHSIEVSAGSAAPGHIPAHARPSTAVPGPETCAAAVRSAHDYVPPGWERGVPMVLGTPIYGPRGLRYGAPAAAALGDRTAAPARRLVHELGSAATRSTQADLLDEWARELRGDRRRQRSATTQGQRPGPIDTARSRQARRRQRSVTTQGQRPGWIGTARRVPVVDPDVAEQEQIRGVAMQCAAGGESGVRRVVRAFRPGSPEFPLAARVAAGAAVAGLVSVSLGVNRPYWAVMTAAVLIVANTAQSWHRTVQRVVGNLVGVGLFTVLVPVTHSAVALVAMALTCQLLVEATISRNYWMAQVFVTPMALAMVEFAGRLPTGRLALDRWLDTCVGAAVAVAICFAVPNRRVADRVAVALHELDAVIARARAALASGRADRGVRERLAAALVQMRESADIAAGEWWSTEVPQDRIVSSERAGHQVLAQLPVRFAVVTR